MQATEINWNVFYSWSPHDHIDNNFTCKSPLKGCGCWSFLLRWVLTNMWKSELIVSMRYLIFIYKFSSNSYNYCGYSSPMAGGCALIWLWGNPCENEWLTINSEDRDREFQKGTYWWLWRNIDKGLTLSLDIALPTRASILKAWNWPYPVGG